MDVQGTSGEASDGKKNIILDTGGNAVLIKWQIIGVLELVPEITFSPKRLTLEAEQPLCAKHFLFSLSQELPSPVFEASAPFPSPWLSE